ncbi:MAG: Fic family protein [Hydrogenophilales bacterium]|nr:Fic family protein [Hydrogenophilales bacterium]
MTSTLRLFAAGELSISPASAWYLSDLGEYRGKQELYTRQSPQRLKALREHALIESAVSSNRIEGVSVEPSRVRDLLVSPRPLFRDRDEEEVRGYRDALEWVHQDAAGILVSEKTIQRLHAMTRGEIWDAGKYKEKDGDIIERYPDGRERVRFRTVPARETPAAMAELMGDWQRCLDERWVPPLIALAAFNLDFLCIHPFRDGNGRVSRLLWLLQSYQLGYEVGRYISLERLVEQNKDRYYETLEQSSQGWHEGKHDPWPYINYVLSILKSAYREFAERVGEIKAPRGAKRDMVLTGIDRLAARSGGFTISELEQACPGVSRDMVRRVLREQQSAGAVECQGRGPGATWVGKGVITPK